MGIMTNEEKVRTVWRLPQLVGEDGDCCISLWLEVVVNSTPPDYTAANAWAAAWAFTEPRLEEIRQLREEIELVDWFRQENQLDGQGAICERILARLKAILVEKTEGMKPEAVPEK